VCVLGKRMRTLHWSAIPTHKLDKNSFWAQSSSNVDALPVDTSELEVNESKKNDFFVCFDDKNNYFSCLQTLFALSPPSKKTNKTLKNTPSKLKQQATALGVQKVFISKKKKHFIYI